MKFSIFFLFSFLFFFSIVNAQPGWTLQTNPLGSGESAMIGKVQFVSATEGWISVSDSAKLLHTTNAGADWSVVTMSSDVVFSLADPAINMSFISPSTGWVLKTLGTGFGDLNGAIVYKTTNGGNNWTRSPIAGWEAGLSIQFVDENNGWITVFNGNPDSITSAALMRTTNGGSNWTTASAAPNGMISIPFFVTPTIGYAIFAHSPSSASLYDEIRKTTNGGVDWVTQYGTSSTDIFNAIYFADANNGWAVGEKGRVVKTSNGGTTWDVVGNTGLGQNHNSKTVFFLNANTGWIGTKLSGASSPTVLHTTNGGASWSSQSTPVDADIFNIFFIDPQRGWFTSDWGRICRYYATTGVNDNSDLPKDFSLYQNYPNPFNPTTIIEYAIPQTSSVLLKVYNLLGQEVATLVDGIKNAGTYKAEWNAAKLNSGVYFYTLQAGSYTETKKLILMK